MSNGNYPGGSKSRVNRAGENVRNNIATAEDILVIDQWRAAHRFVLNTFQAILRTRTRGTDIIVAQRHKRKNTIFDKLTRDGLTSMQLARMDDIAGCRLVFQDINQLNQFRNQLHKARFKHKRRNEIDKYDYINKPKSSGYRGIHDVYIYDVSSERRDSLHGLLIEIQYRTLIQHAWATAVEIIGFITENQPKFDRGDDRYRRAMILASEILARAFEESNGPLPEMESQTLLEEFFELDKEINLLGRLKGLNISETELNENKNAILIFKDTDELDVRTYRDSTDALRALFKLEKEVPHEDIVLVKADSSQEVRLAFKNYFSDARDFIEYVETGCEKLIRRN